MNTDIGKQKIVNSLMSLLSEQKSINSKRECLEYLKQTITKAEESLDGYDAIMNADPVAELLVETTGWRAAHVYKMNNSFVIVGLIYDQRYQLATGSKLIQLNDGRWNVAAGESFEVEVPEHVKFLGEPAIWAYLAANLDAVCAAGMM